MAFYYDPEKKQLTPSDVAFVAANAVLGPLGGVIVGAIFENFFQPGSLEGDDAENIRTIIQAGNENNVDEMGLCFKAGFWGAKRSRIPLNLSRIKL